jgi:hypothetical protein
MSREAKGWGEMGNDTMTSKISGVSELGIECDLTG